MRYVFFGTPEFAAIILEKLIQGGFVPDAVVCNPDRPVGRKKIITPPPTKLLAMKYNIPVLQLEALSASPFSILHSPFSLFIVAAYAKILPKELLEIPRLGVIGVHPSLLPKYRGASPIQSALLNGDTETGVTLYHLDEKMDHGPILAQRELKFPISNFQFPILLQKLAELNGDLLVETLPKFLNGEIKPTPQNEAEATYTRKFTTEDAYIKPEDLKAAQDGNSDKAEGIERKIRALNPEPGVWTYARALQHSNLLQNVRMSFFDKPDRRVKLLAAEVGMKDKKLFLKKIQIEGEKPKLVNSSE